MSIPSLGVAALVIGTEAVLFSVPSWATVTAFVVVAAVLGGMTASQRHDEMIHKLRASGRCRACGYDPTAMSVACARSAGRPLHDHNGVRVPAERGH